MKSSEPLCRGGLFRRLGGGMLSNRMILTARACLSGRPFDVGANGVCLRVDPAVLAGGFDHGEIALLPAFAVGLAG